MMKKGAVTLLFAGLLTGGAHATELPVALPSVETPDVRVDRTWKFVVAPYLLAPTIQGDSRVGRLPNTSLDVSPGTILENLQFGAMVHVGVLYDNRFGASLDMAYMNLGKDRSFPRVGGSIDVGVKQLVTEAFFGYRFWHQDRNWAEAYAGGRWWYNQLKVTANTPANTFTRTITEQWVDPVIGVRGQIFVAPKWSLFGSGNVGGFGLASDFTWGLQGGVGYHFDERVTLHLQYKAIGVNYNNGNSGSSAFSYNTVTHGPLLGIAFSF